MGLAGSHAGAGDMVHKITVAAATTQIHIPWLPTSYQDLRLHLFTYHNGPADIFIRFNGDTGSTYDHSRFGITNGANSISAMVAANNQGLIASHGGGSPQGGATTIDIPNYRDGSLRKYALSHTGRWDGDAAVNMYHMLHAVRWRGTAAITSLTLNSGTTFEPGSVVTLYGLGAHV